MPEKKSERIVVEQLRSLLNVKLDMEWRSWAGEAEFAFDLHPDVAHMLAVLTMQNEVSNA